MYATGYVPDPAGHTRTKFGVLARRFKVTSAPPERDFETEGHAPPVMDQGSTSACTGHAMSCWLFSSFAAMGIALAFIPSPDKLYKNGRAIDRDPYPPIEEHPLTDDGAMPNQVERAIAEIGIEPIKAPTADGRFSDVDPATVNNEPQLGDIEEEGKAVAIGAYEITSTGAPRVADIKLAIANGHAVAVAIAGGSATFQAYTGGVLGPLHSQLDHYVCIIGYRTNAQGKTEFKIRNSWSGNWGEGGNCWINEAAANELGALLVGDVQLKEAA